MTLVVVDLHIFGLFGIVNLMILLKHFGYDGLGVGAVETIPLARCLVVLGLRHALSMEAFGALVALVEVVVDASRVG